MLKKIVVKNFRSLKNTPIGFKKFNVLIGKNASGKSNIIDCLAFVKDVVFKGNQFAINKRGGYQKIVFSGNKEHEVDISLFFEKNSKYSFAFDAKKILREELVINGKPVISYDSPNLFYVDVEGIEMQVVKKFSDCILHVYKDRLSPIIYGLSDIIHYWRFYNFFIPKMRAVQQAKRNIVLDSNGTNLPQVLISLRNEMPKTFQKIEEFLKSAIPDIEELLTPLDKEGNTFVALREKGFRAPFDYYQLSDGTLKLLAYITAINLPSNLLTFEEPENFIHPTLLGLIVEILKGINKQIIIATHSPYLLDHVKLEDLMIVEKMKGATITRRIKRKDEIEKIKILLDEGIPLGEIYPSGAME